MKLHLPLSLRSSLLACMAMVGFTAGSAGAAFTPSENLGNTMFIGDSITHGYGMKSWRWEMHKLLADNGIEYQEVGIVSGNFDPGNTKDDNPDNNVDLTYGDSVWLNRHAARSAERAYEISGRTSNGNRLGGTNLRQWLNLESTGNYHIGEGETPNTYFLLAGTNDLLGNGSISTAIETRQRDLIGTKNDDGSWSDSNSDMGRIVQHMRDASGDETDIVILSVPTWLSAGNTGANANNNPADLAAVKSYNEQLKAWCEWKGVTYVDINAGIVDVAHATHPWNGVTTMFRGNGDALHPSTQGELIIAGNVAKGLGYAGRTAGQQRKSGADFALNAGSVFSAAKLQGDVTQTADGMDFGSGASLTYAWTSDFETGFTVDFALRGGVGNGEEDGWNTTEHFSVSLGDSRHGGTLNINEAYIQWGSKVLYSMDTHEDLTDSLRVAYVYGNNAKGLASGFYVWLGDQLIGEGLVSISDTEGLVITNNTSESVSLSELWLDDTGSWAPTSNGKTVANPLIDAVYSDNRDFAGRKEWVKDGALQEENREFSVADADFSGNNLNIRNKYWSREDDGPLGGSAVGTTPTTSKKHIYVNSGELGTDKENGQDIYLTIEGAVSTTGWNGFHTGSGTYKGNGYVRIRNSAEEQLQWGAWFGAVNVTDDGGVVGDIYLEFSPETPLLLKDDNPYVAGEDNPRHVIIAGVYNASAGIDGEFRVVINENTTVDGDIYGGAIYPDTGSETSGRVKSSAFYLNGGSFKGNIYGGGYVGTVGSSHIVITGNGAEFENSVIISAGGDGELGMVEGEARVTLSQVEDMEAGIAAYEGTISGGEYKPESGWRVLEFSETTLSQLKATIENFDEVEVVEASDVSLSTLGGAGKVRIADDSVLRLTVGSYDLQVVDNMGTVALGEGVQLSVESGGMDDVDTMVGTYVLGADSTLELGKDVAGRYALNMGERSTAQVAGDNEDNMYRVTMEEGSALTVQSGAKGSFSVEKMVGSAITIEDEVSGTYDVAMTRSRMDVGSTPAGEAGREISVEMGDDSMLTAHEGGQGDVYIVTGGERNTVSVATGNSGTYDIALGDDSMVSTGAGSEGEYDIALGDKGLVMTGTESKGTYGIALGDSGVVTIGTESDGTYDIALGEAGEVSIGAGSDGTYEVSLGANGSLTVDANAAGVYHIVLVGGGTLDTVRSSITGTLELEGSAGVAYDVCGGLANGMQGVTLKDFAAGSRVRNMGGSDVTLLGENSITLTGEMRKTMNALLETTGRLTLAEDATLRINIQNVVEEVEEMMDADFYLSLGDVTSLADAGEGKIVMDATALALDWELSFRSTAEIAVPVGALHIHVPSMLDGHNVYLSGRENDGEAWSRGSNKNIYEEVDNYEAVLISSRTMLDITEDVRPAAYDQDGLIMHNLMGKENADLRITDHGGHNTKLTISNAISSEDIALLEEMAGVKVENTLTFAGNITLNNLGLQIKHVDTATLDEDKKPVGSADSMTIMQGNLVLTGGRNVEMTSGVLRLESSGNNFGTGDIIFAGTDSQLVVSGEKANLVVSGEIKAEAGKGLAGSREHIRLEDGGTLEMGDGAHLGDGLVVGRNSAPVDGEVAGVISAQGAVSIARESRLSNVVLYLSEHGVLTVGEAVQPVSRARVSNELDWTVAGLSGAGKLETPGGRADMAFVVSGGNHDFSGDLSEYEGTMSFEASKYTQSFTGVKSSSSWNVQNKSGAQVTFNLYAGDNTLTMGKLDLAQDSVTNLYFDFSAMGADAGLHLQELDAAQGAVVNVGQSGKGLVSLQGEDGDEVEIAIITWTDEDASNVSDSVSWNLISDYIKNAADVRFEKRGGGIYLSTVVDNTNNYASFARSENAMAGAELLWTVDSMNMGGDVAGLDLALMGLLQDQNPEKPTKPANVAEANRIMAAAAGSSNAVLGLVATGDVERQLRAIRNRTTSVSHSSSRYAPVADVWLNAEGDYHKQSADGMLPGYKVNGWGGTVGASHSVGRGKEVGLALTAMYSDVESDGADRLKGDMDAYYVSAFAQAVSGAWRHTVVCTVGTMRFDMNRTVNFGADSYTTKGSTDGTTFGALYEVGYSISLRHDGSVCLQPVANVALRHSSVDAFSESGSNAALDVSQQRSTAVTFGLGARLQAAVDGNFWNRSSLLEARALVKVDCGDRDSQADVAFHGATSKVSTVRSAEKGAVGVELGAGLSLPVGPLGDVFVDCSAELWQNYTNLNAAVGYKIDF